ncbi:MAG: Lrp/AsnC family transcriptional regulator [Flavobacteriaceae bacterium]|jgi:Lrp/AsnC family leucine-responsive transcriptional regulator|nr:Lrp/AsnC family transcriptional regulator [Flavobacteriaceae bacterium]MCO4779386.1 Lrp/AsnC family transcriptional regulator [Flavobacteriaceae bacterium]MCO4853949.1 Lrp/AsnC family transcriptional regulator [Flavobacteriaceae bacterium]MDB4058671.1 Lrp/AsnC family transcriptional regulator [Flavobacteriaceae bacterium]MDB9714003.1 Lrp/AsnC family transcriptional regulator [Flavobacteriaceae bacterium]|tara:strand:- start:1396 stop:1842 length:447 start_codon:yes stop_codon:yes gene_type:complete
MIKKVDLLNNKIVAALQKNARVSFAEIGRIVGLTPPAVAERVKKLEDTSVILKYHTEVSYTKMGYQLKAMITLRAFVGKLKPFLEVVKSYPEVVNCYRITGNENIMMEVVLKDQQHLETFIDTLIQYGETRTHIILSEVVSSAPIYAI